MLRALLSRWCYNSVLSVGVLSGSQSRRAAWTVDARSSSGEVEAGPTGSQMMSNLEADAFARV